MVFTLQLEQVVHNEGQANNSKAEDLVTGLEMMTMIINRLAKQKLKFLLKKKFSIKQQMISLLNNQCNNQFMSQFSKQDSHQGQGL